MFLYKKLKTFLKRPGQYFRYKKKFLRNLYFQFSKFMHFRTYYSRVYKKNFNKFSLDESEIIDRDEGFKKIPLTKLHEKSTNIHQLLLKINNDLKIANINKNISSDDGIISLKSSKDYNCESPEFKFVTNKYLIEIVSKYLNCVPILTSLSLWYSPNNKVFENSSQEYHLDHEDYRQVKGFLFINDIDLQTGPLNIINVKQSEKIQQLIDYKMTKSHKRVGDNIIHGLKKKINVDENIMTGKSGDLLLCDTSSCFHFGSRLGRKSRFILAFQYITPFGFSVDWNWRNYDKLPFRELKCEPSSIVMKIMGTKI